MRGATADEVEGGRSLTLMGVAVAVLLAVLLTVGAIHFIRKRVPHKAPTVGAQLLLGSAEWTRWVKEHPSAPLPGDLSIVTGTSAARQWASRVAEVLGVAPTSVAISTVMDTGTRRELDQAELRGYTFASGALTAPYPADRIFGQGPYKMTEIRGGAIASSRSVALYLRRDGRALVVSCPAQRFRQTLGTCRALLTRLLSSGLLRE